MSRREPTSNPSGDYPQYHRMKPGQGPPYGYPAHHSPRFYHDNHMEDIDYMASRPQRMPTSKERRREYNFPSPRSAYHKSRYSAEPHLLDMYNHGPSQI
jgi:hypothetical protein